MKTEVIRFIDVGVAKFETVEVAPPGEEDVVVNMSFTTISKGTVEIRPLEVNTNGLDRAYANVTLNNEVIWSDNSEKMVFGLQKRYDRLLLQFAKYVRGEEKNPYTYEYEAKLHDLILASCQ